MRSDHNADYLRQPASSAAWIAAPRLWCSVRRGRPCRPARGRRQAGSVGCGRCRITVRSCAHCLSGRVLADRAWAACGYGCRSRCERPSPAGRRRMLLVMRSDRRWGNPAVGVEPRVEDRDLQAACAITGEQAAEDLCGLLPGNAAGMAVVHGWHQGVIENIDVEMHPESLKAGVGDRGQHLLKSAARACLPEFGLVHDSDCFARDMLAEEIVVIVKDPVADQ